MSLLLGSDIRSFRRRNGWLDRGGRASTEQRDGILVTPVNGKMKFQSSNSQVIFGFHFYRHFLQLGHFSVPPRLQERDGRRSVSEGLDKIFIRSNDKVVA